MISDMCVLETGESVLIDLEPEVLERVRGLLEQFIFSEDVQVADDTSSLAQLGVLGPKSADVISGALTGDSGSMRAELESLPVLSNRTRDWHGAPVLIVRRDDAGVPGFDLLIDRGQAGALADALRLAGAIAIDRSTTEITRIEAGRPMFRRDMNEDTIPLEAGIEERAISLTKGCYVGQEIIIRVLHRGHGRVARRLVGLTLDGRDVPAPGDRVRAGDREIGTVTSAVWSPALERAIALGVRPPRVRGSVDERRGRQREGGSAGDGDEAAVRSSAVRVNRAINSASAGGNSRALRRSRSTHCISCPSSARGSPASSHAKKCSSTIRSA